MKLNSKLFDTVRIKPRHPARSEHDIVQCQWEGCNRPGLYKAPKGWRAAGEFYFFCMEHVQQYNQNFDYFDGASDDKIEQMTRQAAATGERPTWESMSAAKPGANPRAGQPRDYARRPVSDPLNLFARLAKRKGADIGTTAKPQRRLAEPDRRALETLGLEGLPPTAEIKKAYKALVKIHHPDANGGDKASEDRMRAIILAYTHLKQKGFLQ